MCQSLLRPKACNFREIVCIISSRPLHHPLQNFFSFEPWLDTLKLDKNPKFQALQSSGTLLFQLLRIGLLDQKMTATMQKWGLTYVSRLR